MVLAEEFFPERDPLWDDVMKYWESAFPYLDSVLRWQHDGYDLREWFSWGDDLEPPSELKIDMCEAETVAEHTTDCALYYTVKLFNELSKPSFVNRNKTSAMLYIHDAGEYYAGEIPVFKGKPEGFKMAERMSFVQLLCETGCYSWRLLDLYDEYENEGSLEALFAKFIDRYQGNLYFFDHQRVITQEMRRRSMDRIQIVYSKIETYINSHRLGDEGANFLEGLRNIMANLEGEPLRAHAQLVE